MRCRRPLKVAGNVTISMIYDSLVSIGDVQLFDNSLKKVIRTKFSLRLMAPKPHQIRGIRG